MEIKSIEVIRAQETMPTCKAYEARVMLAITRIQKQNKKQQQQQTKNREWNLFPWASIITPVVIAIYL
jgi:hypothetical protein